MTPEERRADQRAKWTVYAFMYVILPVAAYLLVQFMGQFIIENTNLF